MLAGCKVAMIAIVLFAIVLGESDNHIVFKLWKASVWLFFVSGI